MFFSRHRFFLILVVLAINVLPLTQGRAGQAAELPLASPAKLASPDTLVICPGEFQPALKDWIDYRTRQGHTIRVISPAPTADAIKSQVREVAAESQLRFVFLIGDMPQWDSVPSRVVPTNYVPAQVNVMFGSEAEIATDNPFGDLDEDGIPDLAIGRLPADTSTEVQDLLARVMVYERASAVDRQWCRRVNFVAGVGGFGGVVDNVLQQTTKQIIAELIPADYLTTMTFGSWRSPYCPDPRRFSETAIGRFNEGCLFWVYLGHGQPTGLDRVHLPGQSHSILDAESVDQLNCVQGSPIAIFLSCYSGAADNHVDCLAEEMLRQPGGSIATICGTRVTMPYAMSLLSLEMLQEYFEGEAETLGELLLVAKQRMTTLDGCQVRDVSESQAIERGTETMSEYRRMIQTLGETLSPRPEMLAAERLEHAQLIHLYGDPLLQLPRPTKLELTAEKVVEPGRKMLVTGVAPTAGTLSLELAYRRDRFRIRPPHRARFDSADAVLCGYQSVYEEAHNLVCDRQQQTVTSGPFSLELQVPENAHGSCVVRCLLDAGQAFGMGAIAVEVRKSTLVREAKQ